MNCKFTNNFKLNQMYRQQQKQYNPDRYYHKKKQYYQYDARAFPAEQQDFNLNESISRISQEASFTGHTAELREAKRSTAEFLNAFGSGVQSQRRSSPIRSNDGQQETYELNDSMMAQGQWRDNMQNAQNQLIQYGNQMYQGNDLQNTLPSQEKFNQNFVDYVPFRSSTGLGASSTEAVRRSALNQRNGFAPETASRISHSRLTLDRPKTSITRQPEYPTISLHQNPNEPSGFNKSKQIQNEINAFRRASQSPTSMNQIKEVQQIKVTNVMNRENQLSSPENLGPGGFQDYRAEQPEINQYQQRIGNSGYKYQPPIQPEIFQSNSRKSRPRTLASGSKEQSRKTQIERLQSLEDLRVIQNEVHRVQARLEDIARLRTPGKDSAKKTPANSSKEDLGSSPSPDPRHQNDESLRYQKPQYRTSELKPSQQNGLRQTIPEMIINNNKSRLEKSNVNEQQYYRTDFNGPRESITSRNQVQFLNEPQVSKASQRNQKSTRGQNGSQNTKKWAGDHLQTITEEQQYSKQQESFRMRPESRVGITGYSTCNQRLQSPRQKPVPIQNNTSMKNFKISQGSAVFSRNYHQQPMMHELNASPMSLPMQNTTYKNDESENIQYTIDDDQEEKIKFQNPRRSESHGSVKSLGHLRMLQNQPLPAEKVKKNQNAEQNNNQNFQQRLDNRRTKAERGNYSSSKKKINKKFEAYRNVNAGEDYGEYNQIPTLFSKAKQETQAGFQSPDRNTGLQTAREITMSKVLLSPGSAQSNEKFQTFGGESPAQSMTRETLAQSARHSAGRKKWNQSYRTQREPVQLLGGNSKLPQEVHEKILRKYHYNPQAQAEPPKKLPVFTISLYSKPESQNQSQTSRTEWKPEKSVTRQSDFVTKQPADIDALLPVPKFKMNTIVHEYQPQPPNGFQQHLFQGYKGVNNVKDAVQSRKSLTQSSSHPVISRKQQNPMSASGPFGSLRNYEPQNNSSTGSLRQRTDGWSANYGPRQQKVQQGYQPPSVDVREQIEPTQYTPNQHFYSARQGYDQSESVPTPQSAQVTRNQRSNELQSRKLRPFLQSSQQSNVPRQSFQTSQSEGKLSAFTNFGLEDKEATTRQLQAFRREYLEKVNSKLQRRGKVNLVEILIRLGFMSLSSNDLTEEQSQAIYNFLKKSKFNLLIRRGEPMQLLSDDVLVNNLFKILCAILNMCMATKGALYLEDQEFQMVLGQCGKHPKDDLGSELIEQLSTICELIDRNSFCLKTHQVQMIHECFYTLFLNRMEQSADRAPVITRPKMSPVQSPNQVPPHQETPQSRSQVQTQVEPPFSMMHQVQNQTKFSQVVQPAMDGPPPKLNDWPRALKAHPESPIQDPFPPDQRLPNMILEQPINNGLGQRQLPFSEDAEIPLRLPAQFDARSESDNLIGMPGKKLKRPPLLDSDFELQQRQFPRTQVWTPSEKQFENFEQYPDDYVHPPNLMGPLGENQRQPSFEDDQTDEQRHHQVIPQVKPNRRKMPASPQFAKIPPGPEELEQKNHQAQKQSHLDDYDQNLGIKQQSLQVSTQRSGGGKRMTKRGSTNKNKAQLSTRKQSKIAELNGRINTEIERDEQQAKRMQFQQQQPISMEILPEEVIFTPAKDGSTLKPQFITEAEFNRPHSLAGEADLSLNVNRKRWSNADQHHPERPGTAQMTRPIAGLGSRPTTVFAIRESEESKSKVNDNSNENEPGKNNNVDDILRAAFSPPRRDSNAGIPQSASARNTGLIAPGYGTSHLPPSRKSIGQQQSAKKSNSKMEDRIPSMKKKDSKVNTGRSSKQDQHPITSFNFPNEINQGRNTFPQTRQNTNNREETNPNPQNTVEFAPLNDQISPTLNLIMPSQQQKQEQLGDPRIQSQPNMEVHYQNGFEPEEVKNVQTDHQPQQIIVPDDQQQWPIIRSSLLEQPGYTQPIEIQELQSDPLPNMNNQPAPISIIEIKDNFFPNLQSSEHDPILSSSPKQVISSQTTLNDKESSPVTFMNSKLDEQQQNHLQLPQTSGKSSINTSKSKLKFPAVNKPSNNTTNSDADCMYHLKPSQKQESMQSLAQSYRPTTSISYLTNRQKQDKSYQRKNMKGKKLVSKFKPSTVKNQDKYLLAEEMGNYQQNQNQKMSSQQLRDIPAAPQTKELICIMKVDLDGGKTSQHLNVYEGQQPEILVHDFSKKHNLAPSAKSKLLEQVKEQIFSYYQQSY